MKTKIIIPSLVVVFLIQLYFPVKLILDKESVYESAQELRLQTAPYDPYNPFKGRYVRLRFKERSVIDNNFIYTSGDDIYLKFARNKNDYDTICQTSNIPFSQGEKYIKAQVSSTYGNKVSIQYPFEEYYMNEYKAPEAEINYRKASRTDSLEKYALVSIKDGDAVLKAVLIDEIPIDEYEID